MPFKNNIYDLKFQKQLPVNVAKIELNEIEQKQAKVKICPSIIKIASDIFTKDLIACAKNGGNMQELKIENVYANKNSSSLCWTCKNNCDMCVCDKNKKDKN